MKTVKWVMLSILAATTACVDDGKTGDTNNTVWEKGGEAYYNNVIDLQTQAGEKYETWSKTMDSLEAIKKLQQFFLDDTTVTSATIGSQGIAVQYSNGMRGGILIDPQNSLENGNLNFRPGQKTITDLANPKSFVKNKKAMLIFAVYRSTWVSLIDDIVKKDNELLPKVGFSTISVYKNQEATVDRFTELSDYGLIDIDSHGFAWPTNQNIEQLYLQTGEVANLNTTLKYWKDVIKGDLTVILESKTKLYFLSPRFLSSHNDFSKDKVLFFAGFCYSNLGGWQQISSLLGGGGYFGFDWMVREDRQYEWIVDLITKLCDLEIRPPFTTGNWMKEPDPSKSYINTTRDNVLVSIHYIGDQDFALWQEPVVITNPITNITPTTATSGGNIKSDGGIPLDVRGVCWSTSSNPTINDSHTIDLTEKSVFENNLTNLTPHTLYFVRAYVRAYGTGIAGITYGNLEQFTTAAGGGDDTFDYEGRTYKYKTIGAQTWMVENLAYLPDVSPSNFRHEDLPFYYVYGYEGTNVAAAKTSSNYATYGVLYNWHAALSACPSGWHLPTDAEWTVLADYLTTNGYGYGGNGSEIGKSMASTSGWTSYSTAGTVGNDQTSNNRSGFTALPGGFLVGYFDLLGSQAEFWTASEDWPNAFIRQLRYNIGGLEQTLSLHDGGFSVRCIKD